MRDANFYYDLGFEHGYAASDEESYPDNPDYQSGYIEGRRFRDRVLQLCPSIERYENGSKAVVFKYCLKGG